MKVKVKALTYTTCIAFQVRLCVDGHHLGFPFENWITPSIYFIKFFFISLIISSGGVLLLPSPSSLLRSICSKLECL